MAILSIPFAIPSKTFLRDSANLAASKAITFDPIWRGDHEWRGNADRVEWAYLRNILQGFAGINKLLFVLVASNLFSFLGDICGHLLDDSNTLRLDLLEGLCQLERMSAFIPQRTANNAQLRVCEL